MSGTPIGVAEISKKHSHVRGTVGLAHPDPGSAAYADSQFYIMKIASPALDGVRHRRPGLRPAWRSSTRSKSRT